MTKTQTEITAKLNFRGVTHDP